MFSQYDAVHLRDNLWAVRPEGCLGTCGWKDGKAWVVRYINARSAQEAINKVMKETV